MRARRPGRRIHGHTDPSLVHQVRYDGTKQCHRGLEYHGIRITEQQHGHGPVDTKPLPADAGRLGDVLFEILKYHVVGDVALVVEKRPSAQIAPRDRARNLWCAARAALDAGMTVTPRTATRVHGPRAACRFSSSGHTLRSRAPPARQNRLGPLAQTLSCVKKSVAALVVGHTPPPGSWTSLPWAHDPGGGV